MKRKAHPHTRGFTLIELMVVLVLVTLMSTMVLPSVVNAVRTESADAQGEKLMELLQFARTSAITRHRAVIAVFDTQRNRCNVIAPTATLPWLETQPETPPPLQTLPFPEGLTVRLELQNAFPGDAQAAEFITFRPDGSADDAELLITDGYGKTMTITVFGITGEIKRVEEGDVLQ